jgi:MOSC domain-containing protein YiiM
MNRTQNTESRLVSINVSRPRTVRYRGREISPGIFKEPVSGRVMVRQLNIEGDAQADLSVHGGAEKAVYVYAAEHYDRWQAEPRQDLAYGQFGENLTVTGITEEGISVGDVLAVGDALLEVTQPRFPCFKLGIKMGDQRFLRRFLQSAAPASIAAFSGKAPSGSETP